MSKRRQNPGQDVTWIAAREATRNRAANLCEGCGRRVAPEAAHCHHRRLRSQGGEHCPSNLLWLCHRCHGWAHEHVGYARVIGWIVPSWANPAETPVCLRDAWWLMLPNGSRESVAHDTPPLFT